MGDCKGGNPCRGLKGWPPICANINGSFNIKLADENGFYSIQFKVVSNITGLSLYSTESRVELENLINLSFDDITNLRALEIESYQSSTGLPIIIFWSGGIDSTLILSAIIKNFL